MKKSQFNYLFTNTGVRIKNMVDLPENTEYLIVSVKNKFEDVTYYEPPTDTNLENQLAI